ncbi:MAG: ABC transporter ATP-binding protein [Ruminiclostridium sp.]|nr:ABC transporter ATP-binding protein [Ruminiclostridium sp.]
MIKIQNVTKKFGAQKALDNLTLEIEKGCAYGLLGSNGAGKSTLLRLLSGIYIQDNGRITIDDEPIYDNPALKEKIFFVSDDTAQFTGMTLLQMKDFVKTFYKTYNEEVFNSLWEILKLPLDKKLSDFSKGMRRQAVVICGLSACTEYLLLDEAFDGLDPAMRYAVKQMLVDAIIDRGVTVIISSHNLKEIEEFCDTVGLIHEGKVIFSRELDSVKGNIHKVQTSFPEEVSKEDFADIDNIEILSLKSSGSVTALVVKGSTEDIEKAMEGKNARFCDIIPLSLEEIFIYEMKGAGYNYEID